MPKSNIAYMKDRITAESRSTRATVTLCDTRLDEIEMLTVPANTGAIGSTIADFATRRCLPPISVEVSVTWPDAVFRGCKR